MVRAWHQASEMDGDGVGVRGLGWGKDAAIWRNGCETSPKQLSLFWLRWVRRDGAGPAVLSLAQCAASLDRWVPASPVSAVWVVWAGGREGALGVSAAPVRDCGGV